MPLFTPFSKFSNIQCWPVFNCAVLYVSDLACVFSSHLLTHNEQWRVSAKTELNEVRGATCKAVQRLSSPSERKRQFVSHCPPDREGITSYHHERRAGQCPVPPLFYSSLLRNSLEERLAKTAAVKLVKDKNFVPFCSPARGCSGCFSARM